MTDRGRGLQILGTIVLAGLFVLVFRFPAPSGRGLHEPLLAFLFPALLFEGVFRGRSLGWAYAAFVLGLVGIFHWVPGVIASKGGLPFWLALLGGALFYAWEAFGFLCVVALARWMHGRAGAWGAALGAALGILLWEVHGFHVYTWSWGAPLGALPWLARASAFLTTGGGSAAFWGCGALAGAWLAEDRYGRAALAFSGLFAGLLALGGAWYFLPRGPERTLDVVMIQPNFEAGIRRPGMEEEMWARSDAELKARRLPRPGVAALLLWPESSVMGRDDRGPSLRLREEARRRGIAWLFGTEGGPLNLVRGEADGRPSFLQAKRDPMPFGERMPGPAPVRKWLDTRMGFISQEGGRLDAHSSFAFRTPGGEMKAHPVICSEALDSGRVREGLALAGGDLITNHTNDGWFDRSVATDLHAAQIRLRAVETGLPLLRATLTGKSGLFRADGTWALWGEPLTEGTYAFSLRWRPVRTPARAPWLTPALLGLLAAGTLLRAVRPHSKTKAP
ncbi:MAG TPA: nitrilase-related carbon-nitrogen hydrolase [Holophaga sp.]|nr:nitrilase-related carbon-nitrogen hydrolase [Holophaga sp.]HPS67662.1 nitrilase-related carbon-nitrogen hydrolase [Holophaga sp.]